MVITGIQIQDNIAPSRKFDCILFMRSQFPNSVIRILDFQGSAHIAVNVPNFRDDAVTGTGNRIISLAHRMRPCFQPTRKKITKALKPGRWYLYFCLVYFHYGNINFSKRIQQSGR